MLALGMKPGDEVSIELPGGEVARVVFVAKSGTGNCGSQTRIGFDFPREYRIERASSRGDCRRRQAKGHEVKP